MKDGQDTNHPLKLRRKGAMACSSSHDGAIPIITLKQPWAWLIAEGHKTIETRIHNRFAKLAGHRIGIHAGLSWDDGSDDTLYFKDRDPVFRAILFNMWSAGTGDSEYKKRFNWYGKIICTAHVDRTRILTADDSYNALIDCKNTKRYGLFLSDIQKIKEPIPFKGALHIQYCDTVPTKAD